MNSIALADLAASMTCENTHFVSANNFLLSFFIIFFFESIFYLRHSSVGVALLDILQNRSFKHDRLLSNKSNYTAQPVQIQISHVNAIQHHLLIEKRNFFEKQYLENRQNISKMVLPCHQWCRRTVQRDPQWYFFRGRFLRQGRKKCLQTLGVQS